MAKPVKVCLLIDVWFPVLGGGQINAWELSKRLVRDYNYQVEIVTKAVKDIQGKTFRNNESFFDGRLKVTRLPLSLFFPNIIGRLIFLIEAFFYILPRKYDLIHAHAFLSGIPAKILGAVKNIPTIFTIHGTGIGVWSFLKPGLPGLILERIEKWILFGIKYDQIISVSSNILKYHRTAKNITVIPNGVDIEEFDKVKTPKFENFKIIFVGRLHSQKGLPYLIEAMREVVKKFPQVRLHIIGDGLMEKDYKQKVDFYHLTENIKFKRRLTGDALIKEYKSSHLFVLPSVYEGQPITLLEAWAAKLPVLVTKVGDNPFLVKEGINGYLVEKGNGESLAKRIIEAIGNKNLAKMGEKGYRLVKEKYSWEKAAESLYRIYQKLTFS